MIAALGLLVACNSGETGTAQAEVATEVSETVDQGIGFNTTLPELKWHLGTEDAIKVVKAFDEKWAAEDYEAMRTFFADTAVCYFPDGRVAKSADEILEMIQAEDDGSEVSWTFDYAFSVDLDPTRGGEHVQAGFTVTSVKEGAETKKSYHESYYIIEGKIVMLTQYTLGKEEE